MTASNLGQSFLHRERQIPVQQSERYLSIEKNMFDWNLYVPDFVRGFFVICVQIFEAYAVRTLIKSGRSWRKISHKGRCMEDSDRTLHSRRG